MTDNKKDNFSEELRLTAAYFWPSIKTVVIVEAIACVLIVVMMILSRLSIFIGISATFVVTIASFIAYFAPLTLNSGRQPVDDTLLPASAKAKWTVLVGVFIILMPVFVQISSIAVSQNVTSFSPTLSTLNVSTLTPWYYYIIGLFSIMAPCATCLYSVIAYPGRKKRAILMVIGLVALLFIIGGIMGVMISFGAGFECMKPGVEPNPADIEEVVDTMLKQVRPASLVLNIVLSVYSIIMVGLTYKKIENRQF